MAGFGNYPLFALPAAWRRWEPLLPLLHGAHESEEPAGSDSEDGSSEDGDVKDDDSKDDDRKEGGGGNGGGASSSLANCLALLEI